MISSPSSVRLSIVNRLVARWSSVVAGVLLAATSVQALPPTGNLRLWLDATDGATVQQSGGFVDSWLDKSGNGNNATAVGAERPTLAGGVFNGQNAIRLDGVNDSLLINPAFNLPVDSTIFMVEKYYGGVQGRTLASATPGTNWLFGLWMGNNSYYNGTFVSYNTPAGTSPWIHQGYTSNGSGVSEFRQNGAVFSAGAHGGTLPGALEIGIKTNFPGEQSQADVSELLIYDRVLSDPEVAQVGQYLTQKYSVPGYVNNLPTQTKIFTGGDPGEGLDFQGNFTHAVQARGPGGQTIGNATFTNDAGIITSENEIPAWISPTYGASAADASLASAMQSIRWTATGDGNQEDVTINLPNLTPGHAYQLQMLFGDRGTARHFGVFSEGSPIVRNLPEAAIEGNAGGDPNFSQRGTVLVHKFIAGDSTLNLRLDGTGLGSGDLNPIINALTLEDLGVGGTRSVGTFSGSSPGQGLDLNGNFVYAVNVQGPAVGQIRDANFTVDTAPGVHLSGADSQIGTWSNPNFGAGADDVKLATVMQSIRHQGQPAGGTMNLDLDNLIAGREYKLQMMFTEACCPGRGFDISVDGTLVADDLSTSALTGVNAAPTSAIVFTYDFIAGDNQLNIALDGFATTFTDKNPILSGFTLELIPVPEPSSLVLLAVGMVGLLAYRRRRGN